MKRSIGEVGFAKPGQNYTLTIMCEERVRLLKLARDGRLPEALELVGDRAGSGFERITPDQVDWTGLGE